MEEDIILFALRTKNTINDFDNLIESKKIFELDDKTLENKVLVITTLNKNVNFLTENEKEILKKANDFAINLNKKCKNETLSKEEQNVLRVLLANTILYGNKEIDKDTLAILIYKYIAPQEKFSSFDLLLYTQHIFNFLKENQGNNTKLKFTFTYTNAGMEAQKISNNENIIKINKSIFENKKKVNKNKFHELLMEMTVGLLHESFHIQQFEYLKRTKKIEQEEFFDDILIATNTKEYKKYHDSLLIERTANEYAINNLPYVLQRIVPEEEIISYQNKLKKYIKTTPTKEYIQKQKQLVQDAKELLAPEGVKTLSENYKKNKQALSLFSLLKFQLYINYMILILALGQYSFKILLHSVRELE